MKILQIGGIIAAMTITAAFPFGKNPSAKPNAAIEAEMSPEWQRSFVPSAEPGESSQHDAQNTSTSQTGLRGNRCALPMKVDKKVKSGANELFGRIRFRPSNMFGSQSIS